ncbi:DUF2201 family putative metallopeptidase, partial [Mycobacterium intracellulare]|uniref:DUF2201 family putative metallopeptidase n=1 Tax=Mycobacterium intracellulare TaxID=1767 RepID=UPI003BF77BB6
MDIDVSMIRSTVIFGARSVGKSTPLGARRFGRRQEWCTWPAWSSTARRTAARSGAGRGTMPAGLARWAAAQLAPAVVPWPKVLRAAVRRAVEDQAGQVHHSWRRPNR